MEKLCNFFKNVFVVTIVIIVVMGMFRGLMLNDNGYILEAARRVSIGQVPYRDFHFMYTPGSVMLLGIFFKIFGASVFVERIVMLIFGAIGYWLIILLLNDYQKNEFLSTLAALIYLVWGSLHINFAWPVMFVLPISFIFLYIFQKSFELKSNRMFYLSGILALLILFFKQNFGIGIILVVFISFFVNKVKTKNVFAFVGGYCSLAGIWFLYILVTQSLFAMTDDFILFNLTKIIIEKRLATKLPLDNLFKILIYSFPLFVNIFALVIILIKKQFKYISIVSFGIVYYLIGIRPTTDYVHLVPLLAFTGLSLYIISCNNGKLIKYFGIFIIFGLIIFGAWSGFFKNYYRWNTPLVEQNDFMKDNKINIFTNTSNKERLIKTLEAIDKQTKLNNQIFVYGDAPLIQFITKSQTPINYLSNSLLSTNEYVDILEQIKKYSINTIVEVQFADKTTVVYDYIVKNYTPVATVSSSVIWMKNK